MERVRDGGRITLERARTGSGKNALVHVRLLGEDSTACGKDVKEGLGVSQNDTVAMVTCERCSEWLEKNTTPL